MKVSPFIQTDLEKREKDQQDVTDRRAEETADLVLGNHKPIPLQYLSYPLLGVALVVAAVGSGLSLIPQHDVMKEPGYWWECLAIQCNLGCFSLGAWFFTTTTPFLLNVEGIYNWKNWLVTWLVGSLACSLVWAGSMAVWVYGLGLRYPAPMVGLWATGWGLFAQGMSCWFQLPIAWRTVPRFRNRALTVLLVHLCTVIVTLFYSGYWWLFTIIPATYQPILALALPVIREVFGHLMSSLGRRCAGGPVPSVELIAVNIPALFHALFLSSCLGSVATPLTGYILLGIDFVINILFTGQVYLYHKKDRIEKCGEALMTLVLNEFLEITVPITFLLCFLLSFYGGNEAIIGNVGSDYFHFVSTESTDIPPFVYNFLILIGIDLLSLIFSSIFLKQMLNINLFQVYCFQQREFGLVLAAQQSHIMDNLFCTIAIGCAIDLSLNFSWLKDAYIMDATDPRFSTNVNISLLQ